MVTLGAGLTWTPIEADLFVLATEVAVTDTDRAAETDAGALYTAVEFVAFDRLPQAFPEHPVPERLQLTP